MISHSQFKNSLDPETKFYDSIFQFKPLTSLRGFNQDQLETEIKDTEKFKDLKNYQQSSKMLLK